MAYILGIDTGGTYTDGVIYDTAQRKIIAKAKALTTYDNLITGIRNCLESLEFTELTSIEGVSLSTTLATNAIVEGRGCEVGLLLIGSEPVDKLPTPHVELLAGGHDVKGNCRAELDLPAVYAAVGRLQGKAEAVAVSGYFSVRNPEHENKVRDIIAEQMGVPVVCAHQLTTALGFHERTITAVLNAKLIPIINNLIRSVKLVMTELGITAPLMIVKGDGTLMSEEVAGAKPIDTILSGPAASIIGSTVLAGSTEAIVVDMGGTTTDVAILSRGIPRLNPEGATVGNWLTRVEAAEVYTYGLGGDSYLQLNADGEISIGPQKVWPLAVMAGKYPYLLPEIQEQAERKKVRANFQPTDCFLLVKNTYPGQLSQPEKGAMQLLAEGPHSLYYLSERLAEKGLINLQRLVDLGILAKISLTPTDILHVKGVYTAWNVEAARTGAEILARELGVSTAEFVDKALQTVINELCLAIIQSLLRYEGSSLAIQENKGAQYLIGKILSPQAEDIYKLGMGIKYPLVAIGAPVSAYFPQVAAKLGAELIIPDSAEVANAVGAAGGKVMERVRLLLKPLPEGRVILHAPWERKIFAGLEEAKQYATEKGRARAAQAAARAGAKDCQIMVHCENSYIRPNYQWDQEIHLETSLEITAVGSPEWRTIQHPKSDR